MKIEMERLDIILNVVLLAMAVSVISLTVTKTKVFRPLRQWVYSWSKPKPNGQSDEHGFFGELISCPFCFSFYPTVLLMALYSDKLRLLSNFAGFLGIIDYVISYFVVVCLASIFTGWIFRSISQIE
jgi:hypothetical protein